jgi:hypothetical protein
MGRGAECKKVGNTDRNLIDATGVHALEREKDSKERDILEKPGGGPDAIRCYGHELQRVTPLSKERKKARTQTKNTQPRLLVNHWLYKLLVVT